MGGKAKKIRKSLSLMLAAGMLMTEPCTAAELAFSDGETAAFTEEGQPAVPEEETAVTDSADSITAPVGEELFSSEEAADFQDEESRETEEEIRYIKGRPLTEEERSIQRTPFTSLKPMQRFEKIKSNTDISPYRLFPAKYDAREAGYVTSVKDQSIFNICWAFATASIMETSLLSQQNGTYDLSEEHLAYFYNNRSNDPLGNTPVDRNIHHSDYHQEGNNVLASQFLSTWSGMVTEKEVPIPLKNGVSTGRTPKRSSEYHAVAYQKRAVFSDYSVERMKALVSEYNSVSVMLNMISDTGVYGENYYNEDTAAYSYPQADGVNHVVTVVGWDDNYSRQNFTKDSRVKADGAWIVKNSWGDYWGDGGYFYVSYEDKSLSELSTNTAVVDPKYRNNYFYDGSSGDGFIGLGKGQSVANVFTAKAAGTGSEILGEVVSTIYNDGAELGIQIYTNLKDPKNPASGTPAYKKPFRYTQALAGIDTISVPEVTLAPGSVFAVAVTNMGEEDLLYGMEQTADYGWMKFQAGINPGQGFIKEERRWNDLYGDEICPRIKAHTRSVDGTAALQAPSVTVRANANGYNLLTWKEVPGADGYKIYRRVPSGKWEQAGSLYESTDTAFKDEKISALTVYEYMVRAYSKIEGKTYLSPRKSSGTVISAPVPQRIYYMSSRSAGMYFRWKPQTGVSGYRIYRRVGKGPWSRLAEIEREEAHSYFDRTAEKGQTYIYCVRPFVKEPYGRLYGRYVARRGTKK